MVKTRATSGFSGQKEDNFCGATNAGRYRGKPGDIWRDTLRKGEIKVTPQLFILLSD